MKNKLIDGWLPGAAVIAMVLLLGTMAEARIVANFSWCGYWQINQPLEMAEGDSLMVRDLSFPDVPVMDRYGSGHWHLGLFNNDGLVVGWAMNWSSEPGKCSWLVGNYSGAVVYEGDEIVYQGLTNGERPVHAVLVYDSTDNGWTIVGNRIGIPQDLADGDLFFTEDNILFNGVLGDISALPPYFENYGDQAAILPSMTVVIPEPATLTMLAAGGLFLRRRNQILTIFERTM